MSVSEGFVCHIKDYFFTKFPDIKFMQNKEDGNYRPHHLCVKDDSSGLIWVVPMSTKIEKYRKLYDDKISKYGRCDTIVLGSYCGKDCAFLIQNMFPVVPKYIDHIHTVSENPVPVHSEIHKLVHSKVQKVLTLANRGTKLTFTDISAISYSLLEELKVDFLEEAAITTEDDEIEL